jgi:hypothetical protein
VYGIEADTLAVGGGLSHPVAHGVREATDRILAELAEETEAPGGDRGVSDA